MTQSHHPAKPVNLCHGYGLGWGYKCPTRTHTRHYPWRQPAWVHKPVTFPNDCQHQGPPWAFNNHQPWSKTTPTAYWWPPAFETTITACLTAPSVQNHHCHSFEIPSIRTPTRRGKPQVSPCCTYPQSADAHLDARYLPPMSEPANAPHQGPRTRVPAPQCQT